MISDTQIHRVGGSVMVVLPDAFVKYLKIDKTGELGKCKIKDINNHEVNLTFR